MSNPAGFREHASGLVVPETVARARRVVTKQDWRLYEDALALYKRLGIRVQMACENPDCRPLKAKRAPDGGAILHCGCTDRVFTSAF